MNERAKFYEAKERKAHRITMTRRLMLTPQEAAFEYDRRCLYCDALLIPELFDFTLWGEERKVWRFADRHFCVNEIETLAAQETAARLAALNLHEQQALSRIRRAGLDGALSSWTFERFEDRADWPEATQFRALVWSYAHSILNGTYNGQGWLVLCGGYGIGKSHLAAAVIHFLLEAEWSEVYFRAWPSYLRRIKATWDRRKGAGADSNGQLETESEIVAELTHGGAVVIDDLDKIEVSDPGWSRGVLFEVLNTRYNSGLPTVVTINRSLTDPRMGDLIGGAVVDRLFERAIVLTLAGPSYRQRGIQVGTDETQTGEGKR